MWYLRLYLSQQQQNNNNKYSITPKSIMFLSHWLNHSFSQKSKLKLTSNMDRFSRAGATGITADSSAFQQGTQGLWLIIWRCTTQTVGAAQSVDATRLSKSQSCGIYLYRRLPLWVLSSAGRTSSGRCGQWAWTSQLQEDQHQDV